MYHDVRPRQVKAVSHAEDVPRDGRGALIPGRLEPEKMTVTQRVSVTAWVMRPAILFTFSVLLFAVSLGSAGYTALKGTLSIAAPMVYIQSNETYEPTPLNYGVQLALTQPDFFKETHESFVESEMTFIEADLSAMEIRYYEDGEEVFTAPILSKGKEGSWWETPAGLYEISYKAENHFSSFGHVYQPWSMAFQGNFFIHGWPYYPDGEPVPEGYSGGCIRLGNEDAEALFAQVEEGTPVLVHEQDFKSDGFLYEPRVPELATPHYLIADIKSSTVLASSDLETVAPIASITKLMTALVAAEYINLDEDVRITQEKYVTTLIPRLEGNYSASMYSLLQLLLVESSNEAAEVIATQIGRDRFIELMNKKAAALGLTHTHFSDPSGLDEENVSSVGDLLRLIQYIHHNRSFILELTDNQDLATAYQKGDFGELVNFNQIEGVDNFIGGKVGETLAAGQTSVSLHRIMVGEEERILAIVLLGSDDRARDIKQLLTYVDERFAH